LSWTAALAISDAQGCHRERKPPQHCRAQMLSARGCREAPGKIRQRRTHDLGVIATTAMRLLMAVRLSPGLTRDTCCWLGGLVTLKGRTGPLLGLTSVIVFAAGLPAVTHQLAIDWVTAAPVTLRPAPTAAPTVALPGRGVFTLGP